ncbi:MAG: DUF1697 domain-containing protein [Flavobacteriales bacterium]|nr:DUF1697 domain-containing protein [Flavobacteriales bacterium]
MNFVAILRGINVSGQKKILMADLRNILKKEGFSYIETYIQSGNIIFYSSEQNTLILEKKIQNSIFKAYQFEVPVIVLTKAELLNTDRNNPFLQNNPSIDIKLLHVTFLKEEPIEKNLTKLNSFNFSPDEFVISSKTIYVYCPGGYGKTKLSNTFFGKKLKVSTTTRNWKTVTYLAESVSTNNL